MAEILLVGKDHDLAADLRSLLRGDGHSIVWLREVERWSQVEKEARPELIVAAVDSAERVLSRPYAPPRGFPAPLLFVQSELKIFEEPHLEDRLVDRLQSPFMAEEFLGRVDALVRVRRVIRRGDRAPEVARGATPRGFKGGLREIGRGLSALVAGRVPRHPRTSLPYIEVAARVADWADRRDMYEPGHAERVTSFSAMISDAMGLPDDEADVLLRSAMLHDIGKVTLPVEVLRQRRPLNDEEMRLVRTHPERGASLLRALDPNDAAARVVLLHHERADGEGYYRKPLESVPRSARILAVAEAYDAMTSARWTEPLRSEDALSLLRDGRGAQFAVEPVEALIDVLKPRRWGIV